MSSLAEATAAQIHSAVYQFSNAVKAGKWSSSLLEAYVALRDLLKAQHEDGVESAIVDACAEIDREALLGFYNEALKLYELDCVQSLGSPVTWEKLLSFPEYLYFFEFFEQAYREYELAAVKPGQHIAYIGSGAVPLTPISFLLIAQLENLGVKEELEVTLRGNQREELRGLLERGVSSGDTASLTMLGVDHDERLRALGQNMLRDLGVEGNFTTHPSLPLAEEFDHYFFAASLTGREALISTIAEKSKRPCKLTFRVVRPGCLRGLLYDSFSAEQIQSLTSRFPFLSFDAPVYPAPDSLLTTGTQVIRIDP